jgi:hypothetical protein
VQFARLAANDALGMIACGYWDVRGELLCARGEVKMGVCAPKNAAGVGIYLDVDDL